MGKGIRREKEGRMMSSVNIGPLDRGPLFQEYGCEYSDEIRKRVVKEISLKKEAELEKLQKAEDKIYDSLMASGGAQDMKDLMIALMLIRRAKGELTR
jgi:hypothetical protein